MTTHPRTLTAPTPAPAPHTATPRISPAALTAAGYTPTPHPHPSAAYTVKPAFSGHWIAQGTVLYTRRNPEVTLAFTAPAFSLAPTEFAARQLALELQWIATAAPVQPGPGSRAQAHANATAAAQQLRADNLHTHVTQIRVECHPGEHSHRTRPTVLRYTTHELLNPARPR